MQKIAFLIVSFMMNTLLGTKNGSGLELEKQVRITMTTSGHKMGKGCPGLWSGNGRTFRFGELNPKEDFVTFIPRTLLGQSVQPLEDVFPQ